MKIIMKRQQEACPISSQTTLIAICGDSLQEGQPPRAFWTVFIATMTDSGRDVVLPSVKDKIWDTKGSGISRTG